jgi:poly-gamma-glutamate biosynthesis protein PgsC/CapC
MNYEYFVNNELVRLTIILGIVISTLFYKQTGMTLGGVIVPGYLALFIVAPLHIAATLAAASLSFLIVHGFLKKRFMLNGRRLFEVEILVALVLQVSWNVVYGMYHQANPISPIIYGIGFVLPGVITHEMGRHGWGRTLAATLIGAMLVYLIIVPLAAAQDLLSVYDAHIASSPLLRTQPYPFTFPLSLLPIAIVISILLDLLFVVVCSLITYLFINRLASRYILAFGRTRLGIMILAGVVIAWAAEILVIRFSGGTFVPWSGFVVIMPMIVSLLASDYERQGVLRTVGGLSLSAAGVWLVMQLVLLSLRQLGFAIGFAV